MTRHRVASASVASLLFALTTLVGSAWATRAEAQTLSYSITGNVRFQIGDGRPMPITFAAEPEGKVHATENATVMQMSTSDDPKSMTIKVGAFTHPGTPEITLPLCKANPRLFQIRTGISITFPATPMNGDPLLNVLQKSGRTGPPTVTWCPNRPKPTLSYNPGCSVVTQKAHPTQGRLRYQRTTNQFGGPISYQLGGILDLAHRLLPPGCPCGLTQSLCQAFFASGPPVETGPIGGPFSHTATATATPPSPGRFRISCTSQGLITYITPTGVGFGVGTWVESWAGPWTTGQLIVSAYTGPLPTMVERFTHTGSDNRVDGVGTISLVAGAVSNRQLTGPNANRGWLNITVPEPATVVSAASAFLLLAACHRLVRRRSR